jgi:hypothetical protein
VMIGHVSGQVEENGAVTATYQRQHDVVIDLHPIVPNDTYYLRVIAATRDQAITVSDEIRVVAGSEGLITDTAYRLRPLANRAGCWARSNQTGLVVMGAVGIVMILLLIWRWRDERRAGRARA